MNLSYLKRPLAAILGSTFLPLTSYAWNATGHMIVADIAYQNLTSAARAKVDNLVGQLNQEYPDMKLYANIAYWPDSIRSQRIETFTHWHYIDNAFTNDGSELKNLVDTDNAVWAVNTIQQVVENNSANVFDRARFLSFLTHIVGDLHQPLHTASLISATHQNGDKGGNSYFIRYNNDKINLHKLWDSGVGAFNDTTVEKAASLANRISATYPKAYFGDRVKVVKPDEWAKEGMEVAKQSAYNTPENQYPRDEYFSNGKKVAEQQVALAGYRLAELLNQLLT